MAVHKKKVGLGVGLGLAAAAASAAGYYFYGSKHATANRKKAGKWAHDMKGEVIVKAKKLKKLDKKAIDAIVNESMSAYKKIKSVDPKELALVGAELKQNWDHIADEVGRATKSAKKSVKKVAPKKKVAKKTAKKK